MIPIAAELLREARLLYPDARLTCNLRFSRNAVVEAFPETGPVYVIKFYGDPDGRSDLDRMRRAARNLPEFAPKPLFVKQTHLGLAVIVRGTDHVPFSPALVRRKQERISRSMARYIMAGVAIGEKSGIDRNQEELEYLAPDYLVALGRSHLSSPAVVSHLDRALQETAFLETPRVAQHGDFTINNLGLAEDGIVIFDWDDYGLVDLAGYDVATFAASFAGFDANRIRELLHARHPNCVTDAIDAYCQRHGGTREEFVIRLPLYILCFLGAKIRLGYGSIVIELAEGLIEGLCLGSPAGDADR